MDIELDIIIQNVKEMLLDRGDEIEEFEEHEVDVPREEFYNDGKVIEFHTSRTTIIFALSKKSRKSVTDELKKEKETNDTMSEFIKKYNNKSNILLIFNNDAISAPVRVQLNQYDKMFQKIDGNLQYFHTKNLLYNPTKHVLVPKHIKLNPDEIKEMMEKYLVKTKLMLPFILHTDVIAKWMGLRHGDIVKIERYNENSGLSFYFRVCV